MVGPMRPQFVLFGSSIVQKSFNPEHGGWGATLANLYARQADVDLRGYEGWNSRQALHVLHQVFPKRSAVQPSLVIVYYGGNDSEDPNLSGAHHVPLSEYVENMRKIAIHLTSLSGNTRLIFLSVPPVNEEQIYESYGVYFGRTNESGRAYSEACTKLCQEMGIKIIDLFAAFQREKDWEATCFVDGIHLTATGNKIVANEILKVLKEAAEWKPNLYYESLPSEFGELGSVDYKSLPFESGEECLSYDPEIACEKTTYNQSKQWPFKLESCQNLGKIGYMEKPTSYRITLFIFCCFVFVTFLYGLRCYE